MSWFVTINALGNCRPLVYPLVVKHPSRWPFLLRLLACMALTCLVWWPPLIGAALAINYWGWPPAFTQGERTAFMVLFLFGWSFLIMRTLVFRVIEPYFNVQSLQNPFRHLFRPEPLYFRSFREWCRWMFRGKEEEQPPPSVASRDSRRCKPVARKSRS